MPSIDVPPVVIFGITFLIVSIASKQIGALLSKYDLPYITGYLFTGMLAGPFMLELLPSEATDELYFIDDISLAVIAFIAGSELYIKELKDRFRSILLNIAGIVLAGLVLIGVATYILGGFIPFISELPNDLRIAAAVLGSTVLLALSPPSTIAVMREVRARGPFSKTVLSVTVVMDVVIIILFAVSVAIASTIVDDSGFDLSFIVILAVDIVLALALGYLVSLMIRGIFSTSGMNDLVKAALLMLIGFIIFEGGYRFTEWSADNMPFKIKIEPLLISMVAGFSITNFSPYRRPFEALLHDISPYVYVAFFTLTGVALKLDVLLESLLIAGALFSARMAAIFVGSYVGGTIAGESKEFRRLAWLGLITQAGIALGLAREAAVEFPQLGNEFATLIIAVVVLNEIFGPLFLKFALRRAGETNEPDRGASTEDGERNAVIFGIDPGSVTLARQLQSHNWQVLLVDESRENVDHIAENGSGLNEQYIDSFSPEAIAPFITPSTDAVVALLEDDNDNLAVAQVAYEKYDLKNIIVQARDLSLMEEFRAMDVRVVDPGSAMINLLDQYVRAPASVELILHRDPDYEIVQVRVTERDVNGVLLRDLRLPTDVLVLEITRDGQSIMPTGYTPIRLRDEVTLVGKAESLEAATLRLGY